MKFYQKSLLTIFVLYLVSVASIASQNISLVTLSTTFRTPVAPCIDKIFGCDVYGQSACSGVYETWARQNCAAYCGFCIPVTTLPPPCTDLLDNCESYGKTTCETAEFVFWAQTNCRAYCRFCTDAQLAELESRKTTIPPELCFDKFDCDMYGDYVCKDAAYAPWATTNCPLFCNFCKGIPTPPKPCVDIQPNCPLYGSEVCSNPDYTTWVKEHCPKFCGLCGATTSVVSPGTTIASQNVTTGIAGSKTSSTARPKTHSTARQTTHTTTRSTTRRTTHSTARPTTRPTTHSTARSTIRVPTLAPTPPLPSAPPLRSKTTRMLIPTLGK